MTAAKAEAERFYSELEAVYEERYQERYGFWRPIIGTVVRKFLECGDLKQGFARVRRPKCREEFLLPHSCRGRCFCPSCHEKRALEPNTSRIRAATWCVTTGGIRTRLAASGPLSAPGEFALHLEFAELGLVVGVGNRAGVQAVATMTMIQFNLA